MKLPCRGCQIPYTRISHPQPLFLTLKVHCTRSLVARIRSISWQIHKCKLRSKKATKSFRQLMLMVAPCSSWYFSQGRKRRKKHTEHSCMHACLCFGPKKRILLSYRGSCKKRCGIWSHTESRSLSKDVKSHDTSMLFNKMDVKDNHRLPRSLINSPLEHLSDMVSIEDSIPSFCCVYHQSKYQFLPFPELLASKQIFCDLLGTQSFGRRLSLS